MKEVYSHAKDPTTRTDPPPLRFAHCLLVLLRVQPCHRVPYSHVSARRHRVELLATSHASLRCDDVRCYMAGMDDTGLLHLASHMPQLLHLDVAGCSRITDAGLAMARTAAAECSDHGMVITPDVADPY